MAIACASVADIMQTAWSAARTVSPPAVATVQSSRPTRRARAALLHLSTPESTDSKFCFQVTKPKQVDIPFFKVQD